ncbi:Phox homologous domain-containing protein [Bombardia bombarda]|uniref:Endosomal/vacuolar adapter protein YPT35 n=1 Tax=Bombardia bombarda TaxID=252184 RepID=A0AA40BYP9_9PEZI|nr:Phox homologous domain-containing protein [Bombardia bombarda]
MASEIENQPRQPHRPAVAAVSWNGAAAATTSSKAPGSPVANGESTATTAAVTEHSPPAPLFADDATATTTGQSASDDGASEHTATTTTTTTTSPTVTSPPYWALGHGQGGSEHSHHGHSHGHGHGRALSNMSAESVLPPDAITLQDNEYDDGPDGSNFYGRDRNRACWAKSVNITDYVLVNGSTTNIGAFVVWNIKVETLNGSYMNIRKRYSEFDDLRSRLVQTFPSFEAAVPVLPPKSVISKFRPKFLEKRRAGLQYFLNCIMLNPEFSGSPVLKEFLFS